MTATRYRALQLQRSYAAPQNMCISIRAAARMDVPKLLASRAARCNYSAATPRPHRWFFRANARSAFAASRAARCNYSAAAPRRKTCVFPFARQREWMCQNYWHRAQRDATTTRRSRVAKHVSFHSRGSANGCAKTTGIARSAMQLQRGYAAPSLQIL